MRTLFTLILAVATFSISAQTPFDFRKVSWKMSLEEVEATEKGQTLRYSNSDMLMYDNVKLSSGQFANIAYFFDYKNHQLFKVSMTVLGDDTKETRGTCDHIIPFSERINLKKSIVNSFFEQKLECTEGWYVKPIASATEYPLGKGNCSLDKSDIDKLEARAMEAGAAIQEATAGLIMANDRVQVDLSFNAYDIKTKDSYMYEDEPCDINYYNTYFLLTYEPSQALRDKWAKEGK
ncbi:hypothetical protein ACV07N_14985 [Roseivirga echinicomitans]